jgi:5'-methylthioadenosine phosphorylase
LPSQATNHPIGDLAVEVGVIGGSGFYEMSGFVPEATIRPDTPFGLTSSDVVVGEINDVKVAFLARHGSGHRLAPDAVPYRANVYALKALGAHTVVGVNAVGSLDLRFAPGELALPDDLVDRTHGRPSTFFGDGLVVHVGFADPLCTGVRQTLLAQAEAARTPVRPAGPLVVIAGPRFSTRAESRLYRSSDNALIGMTTMPEAVLAREAELCYATVCIVTDYDVWHETEEPVTVDAVIKTLKRSVREAQALVAAALPELASRADCACRHALATAITTSPDAIDKARASQLQLLVNRYTKSE